MLYINCDNNINKCSDWNMLLRIRSQNEAFFIVMVYN